MDIRLSLLYGVVCSGASLKPIDYGLDVRELHDPSVGEALLPQQRVLERSDHKYGDENNQ